MPLSLQRKNTLNGYSDTRSVQENFDLLTSFIQDSLWNSVDYTTVINDWVKILDNRGQADTIILDFVKAFDTPRHELLKRKLYN